MRGESSSNKGTTGGPLIPLHQPAATFTPATPTGESIESMKSRRAADEKEAQDLTSEIKSLEEVLHNQVRPTDLASVRKGGAPIYSKLSENAPVLLTATAEDEFQIIEVEGGMGARANIRSFSRMDSPHPFGNACRACANRAQIRRCGACWRRAFQSEPARNEQFRGQMGAARRQNGKGNLGRAGVADCQHDASAKAGVCKNTAGECLYRGEFRDTGGLWRGYSF